MPLAVEFHPDARTDFYDAIDWYENERPGLGVAFTGAVQDAISLAADSAHIGSPAGTGIRRVFVRAFPYTVLYAVESARLLVVAVAHFRRRPGYWRHRR